MKNWMYFSISVVSFLLIVFLFQQFWIATPSKTKPKAKPKAQKDILYWIAPMNPNFKRDKPGKSPMGMNLVPVYADSVLKQQGVIKITPAIEQRLGVKTTKVKRMNLSRNINTVGSVAVDENNIEQVHSYTNGWVKKLEVKTTGERVQKNQLLLELYSPVLNNAQEELLLALKNKNALLIKAGKQKLETLGMAPSQINTLMKSHKLMQRVKLYTNQGGIVSKLNVREGMFIKPNTRLMTIEDLSKIWILVQVYERQANWVSVGQNAKATLDYMPGKQWLGKVDYVYPALNPKTRTLKVRLVFNNPNLTLKPKMYAHIKIYSATVKNALAIPRSALIRTGDGDRVILSLGNGRFKAQAVKIGIESGDYYQILSGLTQKDRVVTSAQFLIDSESNIKAGFDRLNTETDNTND